MVQVCGCQELASTVYVWQRTGHLAICLHVAMDTLVKLMRVTQVILQVRCEIEAVPPHVTSSASSQSLSSITGSE
jgi:hypothetical protein